MKLTNVRIKGSKNLGTVDIIGSFNNTPVRITNCHLTISPDFFPYETPVFFGNYVYKDNKNIEHRGTAFAKIWGRDKCVVSI